MSEPVRPRTRGELSDAWFRHLALQRGLSEHTVRAYVADVEDLLTFLGVGADADEPVGPALASLDLADLRAWLARMSASGSARATIARRSAAVRAFSAWAHRGALLTADVAVRLRSPRADNRLPAVLTEEQARALLAGDHDGGVPADPASELALQGFVPRVEGLVLDGDRVDVGRDEVAGHAHAPVARPLLQSHEDVARPLGSSRRDEVVDRFDPLTGLLGVDIGHLVKLAVDKRRHPCL